MIYKQCSRCRKRISAGTTCMCMAQIKRFRDQKYDKEKRDKKLAAFYASKAWGRVQKECREKYCDLDIFELYRNNRIVQGRIAHHIIPIRIDWEKRFDIDNTIYLSDTSHRYVHEQMDNGNMEIIDELQGYQERWDREGGGI